MLEDEKKTLAKGSQEQEEDIHQTEPRLHKVFNRIWSFLPNPIGTLIATCIIFILGSTMRGDWLLIAVHFMKYLKHSVDAHPTDSNYTSLLDETAATLSTWTVSLEALRLQNLYRYIIIDVLISYTFYFGVCEFLNWWFYVRQRDTPENWKCQPKKWLSPELERHELMLGSKNIGIGSVIFGTIACYIDNGGYTTLYNEWDAYGWPYLIISIPLIFFFQDACTYYGHRLFHTPYLYKTYHKVHHLYKQPTPYSASALHTVEFLFQQFLMLIPAFTFPLHTVVYFGNLLYMYYYGIMTHSGIDMKSIWPWQPETMFHDNHHQYFHVNYGFNLKLWDYLHGTMRQKDRIYNENVTSGRGKSLCEASEEEIKMYQEELENEIKSSH